MCHIDQDSALTAPRLESFMTKPPPDGLPIYRLLTGPDDAAFCHRVSGALALGYRLHGDPSITFNGEHVVAAQAVVWPCAETARQSLNAGSSESQSPELGEVTTSSLGPTAAG